MSTPGTSIPQPPAGSLRPEQFLDLIAPKLLQVERELRHYFESPVRTIEEVGAHILDGGGKRLRPALLLLTSKMLGYEGDLDVKIGAVVEMIHTATLIHDDIIDDAEVRRGKTSINYRWGNHLTVLVGDYLYVRALDTALEARSLEILKTLSTATIRMTEGEILALELNGRPDLSREAYFDVIERKTAALFGAACRIPGYLVAHPDGDRLIEYGRNLGVCFQLIDDVLDYTSSTAVLGKPALSDLREGKITLPLILARPRASDVERRLIDRVVMEKSLGPEDPGELVAIANRYDAIEETRDIARDFAARASAALRPFPASEARHALEYALEFVMARER
ncbi:MAG TPA: polyprenyl synthetase family protein [Thermoanaerobaculia bacterium]|nr:polyprenyl synthetase family protein [Thermoanaerobaculia bacterium]